MVFNATFNNIPVMSWWSVLLVEETGENHRPVASHRHTFSHAVVLSTPRHERHSNSQLYHTITTTVYKEEVSSWSWSYNSRIYNYLCNQCLSPLILWVRISPRRGVLAITLCDKVCQWLVIGSYFSPVTPVSSTSKTDPHNITEILLNATLNTISLTLYKDEPKTIDINNGRNHLTKMS